MAAVQTEFFTYVLWAILSHLCQILLIVSGNEILSPSLWAATSSGLIVEIYREP